MNKENVKIKNDFLQFIKSAHDISDQTIENYDRILKSFIKNIGNKKIKELKEKDILNYLNKFNESSFNPRLSTLNQLYRYYLNLDRRETPEILKRIRFKSNNKILNKRKMEYMEKVVTEEEYQKLIDNCSKYQHKAIIETLRYFGIRNTELRSMKIKGVKYEDGMTKIKVYQSKTKLREVIYNGRADYLLTWIKNYHPKPEQNNYVFTVTGRRPYTKGGLEVMIKRTCKRAGIKKILPHDLRHTKITFDRKNGIPDTHITNNHGLVKGSRMLQVYDHNESKDFEEWIKQNRTEIKPTFELLEKQKKILEEKHEKEIQYLKNEFENMKEIMIEGFYFNMKNIQRQIKKGQTEDIEVKRFKKYAKEIDNLIKNW